jgi:hypothetical protein
MKPASQITDRAKRYRANSNPPPGPRRCTFCASRKNVDIDHVSGNEFDDSPENKMYLCRSCNTRKGITQARHRIGTRTRQYNPFRVPTFAQSSATRPYCWDCNRETWRHPPARSARPRQPIGPSTPVRLQRIRKRPAFPRLPNTRTV